MMMMKQRRRATKSFDFEQRVLQNKGRGGGHSGEQSRHYHYCKPCVSLFCFYSFFVRERTAQFLGESNKLTKNAKEEQQ